MVDNNLGEKVKELEATIAHMQAELTAARDIEEIEKLQRTYGYYLDNRLWDDIVDLFSDNTELMVYMLRDKKGFIKECMGGSYVKSDGTVEDLKPGDVTSECFETWESPKTKIVYPSGWNLEIPRLKMKLKVITSNVSFVEENTFVSLLNNGSNEIRVYSDEFEFLCAIMTPTICFHMDDEETSFQLKGYVRILNKKIVEISLLLK